MFRVVISVKRFGSLNSVKIKNGSRKKRKKIFVSDSRRNIFVSREISQVSGLSVQAGSVV